MPLVTVNSNDLMLVMQALTRGKRVADGAALARIGLAAMGCEPSPPKDPMATTHDDVINYLNRAQRAEEELGRIRQMLSEAGVVDYVDLSDGKGYTLSTEEMVGSLITERDRWRARAREYEAALCGPADEPPKKLRTPEPQEG